MIPCLRAGVASKRLVRILVLILAAVSSSSGGRLTSGDTTPNYTKTVPRFTACPGPTRLKRCDVFRQPTQSDQ